ncbi:unnamed protein product, partial [Cylindrotheca closterium]
ELPSTNTAPWLTDKDTKARWTTRIHKLRTSSATGSQPPQASRTLKFELDENTTLKNSFMPVKKEKNVTGSESSYKLVGDHGANVVAPDFAAKTPTSSSLKNMTILWTSEGDLYRFAEVF